MLTLQQKANLYFNRSIDYDNISVAEKTDFAIREYAEEIAQGRVNTSDLAVTTERTRLWVANKIYAMNRMVLITVIDKIENLENPSDEEIYSVVKTVLNDYYLNYKYDSQIASPIIPVPMAM